MSKTPIGPTVAVSALLAGTLLVWGGITNRNPVAVLRAVLGGKPLPASGSWGGSGASALTAPATATATGPLPADAVPSPNGERKAPNGESLRGPILQGPPGTPSVLDSIKGIGGGYYSSTTGRKFWSDGTYFYEVT